MANVMGNGRSTCTGLPGRAMLQSNSIRRFSTHLGSEAIREGQALGYQLEEVLHLPAETIVGLAGATKRDARPRPAALFGFQIHFLRAAPLDVPRLAEGPSHRNRTPQWLRRG
ncbi:hypothetical protein IVB48_20555 [Bradyrhizobium sp. 76]|nr:hypothetical protein [Bradyrhizobium sp. 76]